ncbi:MAG: hypothetical protein HDT04_03995 [Bacteroidales bacterium]|nr:hypothetical protein [Bacteroidales bacterium]
MKEFLIIGLMLFFLCGCSDNEHFLLPPEEANASPSELIEPEPDSLIVNSFEHNRVIQHFASSSIIRPTMSRAGKEIDTLYNENGEAQAYVTNFENNQGYVVVSATKDYLPIIAWGDTGHFDANNMPDALKLWFADLNVATKSNDNILRNKYHEVWHQYEKVV